MRPAFRPPPTPHSPPHVPTPPPPPPHPPGAASALPPPCPRRSAYVPEETRSTIINCFRIPLNLFVCVVLYNVSAGGGCGGQAGSWSAVLGMCPAAPLLTAHQRFDLLMYCFACPCPCTCAPHSSCR